MITLKYSNFTKSFVCYLVAFLVSALTVTVTLLHRLGILKCKRSIVTVGAAIACIALVVMTFVYFNKYTYEYAYEAYNHDTMYVTSISYFGYMTTYSFRSVVLSFVANMAVMFGCSLINGRIKKKESLQKPLPSSDDAMQNAIETENEL